MILNIITAKKIHISAYLYAHYYLITNIQKVINNIHFAQVYVSTADHYTYKVIRNQTHHAIFIMIYLNKMF